MTSHTRTHAESDGPPSKRARVDEETARKLAEDHLTCSICLEAPLADPHTLVCSGMTFCLTCIEGSYYLGNRACPLTRKTISGAPHLTPNLVLRATVDHVLERTDPERLRRHQASCSTSTGGVDLTDTAARNARLLHKLEHGVNSERAACLGTVRSILQHMVSRQASECCSIERPLRDESTATGC